MNSKRLVALLLAVVLCVGLLAGCGSGTSGESQNPQSGNSGDTKEHPVLNLRLVSDVTCLDPQVTTSAEEYQLFIQIFDPLVNWNGSKSEAIPALAESWTISDDGITYVFNLRRDVKWHDGSDFTAEDVVFTMERTKVMPATASKGKVIKSATALDDYTVEIVLEYAYPNFILQLASFPFCIVNKDVVEKYGDGNEDMLIGTGAYKFVSNTTGVGVTLEANKDYWDGEPYFETINYKVIPDNNTALTSLLNGEIDLDSVSSTLDVDLVNSTDGMTVHSFKRNANYFLAMNMNNPPFNNEYFRKAVAYAIDKDAYVSLVYNDQAYANTKNVMIAEDEEGYTDEIVSYDYSVEKAKEMLALSGLSQDEMVINLTVSTTGYGPAFGAAFQESMKAIGVQVNLISVEGTGVKTKLFAGEYDACAWNLASIPYNCALYYRLYFQTNGYLYYGGPVNFDDAINTAAATIDDATRIAIYQDMNVQLSEICNAVHIAYLKQNYGCSEHLKGMDWYRSILTDRISNWYWE